MIEELRALFWTWGVDFDQLDGDNEALLDMEDIRV